jgi:small subunit ribosomal protein S4
VSKALPVVNTLEKNATLAAWVKSDLNDKVGVFVRYPERSELNPDLKESYIIEYYNRLI